MTVVRLRRRFQIHGHAIPAVNVNHKTSPTVHTGFDTDRPTFRTATGFSRPTAHLLHRHIGRPKHPPPDRNRTPPIVPPAA